MQLQKQGKDECLLAVIAMLTDNPLDEVRKKALEITGRTTWAKNRASYNMDIIEGDLKVLAYFKLPEDIIKVNKENVIFGLSTPELSGKGAISIQWADYSSTGHVVAFENGKIYEPNGMIFDSWEQFVIAWLCHGKMVGCISVTKLSEEPNETSEDNQHAI